MKLFKRGRREKILVDKNFQLRSALRNVLYMTAVGICLSLPFVYFIRATNFLVYRHSAELNSLVQAQQRNTIITVVLYFVFLICISALITIWQSHKIAGPVIGLKRGMEKLSEGRFSTRVQLRAGDELKALAKAFNEMAEKLEAREMGLKARIDQSMSSSKKSTLSSL